MVDLLSNKFLCSFVLTQKNQKVKKEKIYSTFLSFALIGLSLYCDFSIWCCCWRPRQQLIAQILIFAWAATKKICNIIFMKMSRRLYCIVLYIEESLAGRPTKALHGTPTRAGNRIVVGEEHQGRQRNESNQVFPRYEASVHSAALR